MPIVNQVKAKEPDKPAGKMAAPTAKMNPVAQTAVPATTASNPQVAAAAHAGPAVGSKVIPVPTPQAPQETNISPTSTQPGDNTSNPRTKNLSGFWVNQNDEVKVVRKKRFAAVDGSAGDVTDPVIVAALNQPTVIENVPAAQKEGVARAQDPGEFKKPVELDKGHAKNVASAFQPGKESAGKKAAEEAPSAAVKPPPLQKPLSKDAPVTSVHQGEPTIIEAQSSVKARATDNDPIKPGMETRRVAAAQRGSAIVAVVLAENQPAEADPGVVRAEDITKDEPVLESGHTKNLLQQWKSTEIEYNQPKTSTSRLEQGAKPSWIAEIQAAKEGVDLDAVIQKNGEQKLVSSSTEHQAYSEVTSSGVYSASSVANGTSTYEEVRREYTSSVRSVGEPAITTTSKVEVSAQYSSSQSGYDSAAAAQTPVQYTSYRTEQSAAPSVPSVQRRYRTADDEDEDRFAVKRAPVKQKKPGFCEQYGRIILLVIIVLGAVAAYFIYTEMMLKAHESKTPPVHTKAPPIDRRQHHKP